MAQSAAFDPAQKQQEIKDSQANTARRQQQVAQNEYMAGAEQRRKDPIFTPGGGSKTQKIGGYTYYLVDRGGKQWWTINRDEYIQQQKGQQAQPFAADQVGGGYRPGDAAGQAAEEARQKQEVDAWRAKKVADQAAADQKAREDAAAAAPPVPPPAADAPTQAGGGLGDKWVDPATGVAYPIDPVTGQPVTPRPNQVVGGQFDNTLDTTTKGWDTNHGWTPNPNYDPVAGAAYEAAHPGRTAEETAALEQQLRDLQAKNGGTGPYNGKPAGGPLLDPTQPIASDIQDQVKGPPDMTRPVQPPGSASSTFDNAQPFSQRQAARAGQLSQRQANRKPGKNTDTRLQNFTAQLRSQRAGPSGNATVGQLKPFSGGR